MFILLTFMMIQDMDVCVAAAMFPDRKAEIILRQAGERSLPYLKQRYKTFVWAGAKYHRIENRPLTGAEIILAKKLEVVISDVYAPKIKKCIDGLGDNSFFVRERCYKELLEAEWVALPLLQECRSKDPEVIWRIESLIKGIGKQLPLHEEIPAPLEEIPTQPKDAKKNVQQQRKVVVKKPRGAR